LRETELPKIPHIKFSGKASSGGGGACSVQTDEQLDGLTDRHVETDIFA